MRLSAGFQRQQNKEMQPGKTTLEECTPMGGVSVRQDDHEAVCWFSKAAEQGDAAGQNNFGRMYADGWGVRQDDHEAACWFSKATEQGDEEGLYNPL